MQDRYITDEVERAVAIKAMLRRFSCTCGRKAAEDVTTTPAGVMGDSFTWECDCGARWTLRLRADATEG